MLLRKFEIAVTMVQEPVLVYTKVKIVSGLTPLPRGSRSDTTSESKTGTRYENCGEIRLPEPTSLVASCSSPDIHVFLRINWAVWRSRLSFVEEGAGDAEQV